MIFFWVINVSLFLYLSKCDFNIGTVLSTKVRINLHDAKVSINFFVISSKNNTLNCHENKSS